MKLFLNCPRHFYAAEQICLCIFPDSKPEFVSQDEADIKIFLTLTDNGVFAKASYLDGAGEAFCNSSPDETEQIRRERHALKIAFYRAVENSGRRMPDWGALTGVRPSKLAAKLLESGLSREEASNILENDYFVKKAKRELALDIALQAIRLQSEYTPSDASLYIGIPFCASKCKYCSFVSHSVARFSHLIRPYLELLKGELDAIAQSVRNLNINIKSIYIGGGTPTALGYEELSELLFHIASGFDLKATEEFTVEAGRPDTADINKIKLIGEYATRISVNPQTMSDEILQSMGRTHTVSDILRMFSDIRENTKLQINMDLIAGLPGDCTRDFTRGVDKIISLAPENITVHTLALKRGSLLREENTPLPDAAEMVDYARRAVINAGYFPYYLYRQKYMADSLENIGYCKKDAACKYNIYIMDEIHTIFSAGSGGVTKLISPDRKTVKRLFNPKYPYEYIADTQRAQAHMKFTEEFYNAT